MKMDLIQMIDTLERVQQRQYVDGVQDVIRCLRQMLKDPSNSVIAPERLRNIYEEPYPNDK